MIPLFKNLRNWFKELRRKHRQDVNFYWGTYKKELLKEFGFDPKLPTMNVHSYYYDVMSSNSQLSSIRKVFKTQHEAVPRTFWLLDANKPSTKKRIPTLLGKFGNGLSYIDLSKGHTLVAGQTGEGKTSLLRGMLISLMLFSHPEYMRIVCLDPKRVSFKTLDHYNVCKVANTKEDIINTLQKLIDEMDKRNEFLLKYDRPDSMLDWNAVAYRMCLKKSVYPYIIVLFDEFADFITSLSPGKNSIKKESEEGDQVSMEKNSERAKAKEMLMRLLAKGRSAGIFFVLSTQTAHVEFLSGATKANIKYRISFFLPSARVIPSVLGREPAKDFNPINLERAGRLVFYERDKYRKGISPFFSWKCLLNASKNLKRGGFDFRPKVI